MFEQASAMGALNDESERESRGASVQGLRVRPHQAQGMKHENLMK